MSTGVDGFVLLSGPPGSGKSTLGPPLARALGWPYLAKDTLKQALLDQLGAADVEASRRLGAAAMAALVAVAAEAGSGVLDGTWLPHRTPGQVAALGEPVVEVFCRCPQPVMEQRYRRRASTRGAGHFDDQRSWQELWGRQTMEPVAGGWPVVEVATDGPVDVAAVARAVRQAAATP